MLVLAASVAGLATGLVITFSGAAAPERPPEPLTLGEKRMIERELEAAKAARVAGLFGEVTARARPVYELARAHRYGLLAEHIRGVMARGCPASATLFHVLSALSVLRTLPTAPA